MNTQQAALRQPAPFRSALAATSPSPSQTPPPLKLAYSASTRARTAHTFQALSQRTCPECKSHVSPTPPRFVDLLVGLFGTIPVVRYRCRSMHCGWQGKLGADAASAGRVRPYDGRDFVLAPSLMGRSTPAGK